ncbi:glycosyltransferase family 2 protein [Pedobacter sp. SYSU D00535]|uniref:glycosyltransferase family 2 protein n=1 Tax=Pedobacter sp. SYSU D00535 TaxID=2810308 RepID=UPI001A97AF00|nr:glycosyltransferase family 2 protein [Pedobacter sp. SYSU D00535]
MSGKLDLTIVIPVKNEEKNLAGCLEAIGSGLAARIDVVDSGSTDRTKEIAVQFGANVIDFSWNGQFPKKRNWYLRNHTPSTKWVLFLDADEYLTEEFKEELRRALQEERIVGYWLKYTIYFLGEKLKGGYPLDKLALFRVGAGEYERIDEEAWSKLDMEVHEHPVLEGEIGRLQAKIDHLDFRGVAHYVNKHVEYANWEAARFLKKLDEGNQGEQLTWKQKIKYALMQSVFIGPVYFLGSFFLLGGFRDGARGFAFAILKMAYFTQVYCRIRELKAERKRNNK